LRKSLPSRPSLLALEFGLFSEEVEEGSSRGSGILTRSEMVELEEREIPPRKSAFGWRTEEAEGVTELP